MNCPLTTEEDLNFPDEPVPDPHRLDVAVPGARRELCAESLCAVRSAGWGVTGRRRAGAVRVIPGFCRAHVRMPCGQVDHGRAVWICGIRKRLSAVPDLS